MTPTPTRRTAPHHDTDERRPAPDPGRQARRMSSGSCPAPKGAAADDGVATVWTACAAFLVLALLVVGLDLGTAVVARHRAEAAADLGALAAATVAAEGEQAACGRARGVAAGMGTELTHCTLDGWTALVEVAAGRVSTVVGGPAVLGRAVAGPADPMLGEVQAR